MGAVAGWCHSAWRYSYSHYWELPANVLEGITLVLVVFVQDVAFKESIVTCAGLLTASFVLHGLAYRAGQCQIWPKVIELTAPLLFYGMIPAAYLHTYATYQSAFIMINFWFVAVELVFLAAGRNFIEEYLNDWNPKEVWGTPLFCHCARVVAACWIVCQVIMGLAQVVVVAANISIDINLVAGIMLCYVMQLLPLLWAVAFTFVYPARVQRRWGYVKGVRASCYLQPAAGDADAAAAASSFSLPAGAGVPGAEPSRPTKWQRMCSSSSSSGNSMAWLLKAWSGTSGTSRNGGKDVAGSGKSVSGSSEGSENPTDLQIMVAKGDEKADAATATDDTTEAAASEVQDAVQQQPPQQQQQLHHRQHHR